MKPSQRCIEGLAKSDPVNESVAIFSLERGGSLLGDHIVDIRSRDGLEEKKHFPIPKPPNEKRLEHIQNMLQEINRYVTDSPQSSTAQQTITIAIAETAISGTAANTLLPELGKLKKSHPNLQFNIVLEQQTIHSNKIDHDDYLEPTETLPNQNISNLKGKHIDTNNTKVITGYTNDIIGEDTGFQIEHTSQRPVLIMAENYIDGYEITPKKGQLTRDVIRDIMAGKYPFLRN
ncbi:hypothetical protein HOH87_04090 [bacterium]|nr:hypothetical protein [bacterium]